MPTFASQNNTIRGLSKTQYAYLAEMCQYANNLYNVALYNIRQYYFAQKRFLCYESNYHECKTNENYVLLQAGIAQQILKVADRSFKSFFNLLKKCKKGEYRYQDVKMPHYRKKDGYFNLILSTNAINIKDGYLTIPVSREFRRLHPNMSDIHIPFPERLNDKTIKEVRIIPYGNCQFFRIQYVYEMQPVSVNLDTSKMLAIDLGVDNLATCISNVGTPFIIDGRKLKSINQYWNKEIARLQSIADKQQVKGRTHRMNALTLKRNRQMNDGMKKATCYIINYCLKHHIGTLIIGYNKDFKTSVELGHVNNQNFVQMPIGLLRDQLAFLCDVYGIDYIEQEESYTSKSSFFDDDELPVYAPDAPYTGTFSGHRIHRGLYRCADGTLINADVNGALNILRKSKQKFNINNIGQLSSGLLASPLRIRLQ